MSENETIFGKILRGEIPSDKVYEDDHVVAFKDINATAPVHILVIPRKHVVSLFDVQLEDRALMGHLMWAAAEVARQQGLEEGGFRLVMNNGAGAGQSVFHMHAHVIGGRELSWPPG
jgi:histidine triad (HIT) family protein